MAALARAAPRNSPETGRNQTGCNLRSWVTPSIDAHPSAFVEDSRFEARAQIFIEPDAQVGFALRLVQRMECPRLPFVVGASQQPRAGAGGKLCIGRKTVAQRREARDCELW